MDLRNYGVIDFAEHVVLPTGDADDFDNENIGGVTDVFRKGTKQAIIDDLNKKMNAVRAENQRYLAQHRHDQREMHNLRVENEQHNKLLEDTVDEKNKIINDLEDQIKSLEDENDVLKNQTYEHAARANKTSSESSLLIANKA